MKMLKISKDLFTAWNEANLLYCHWKSNECLLSGLDGGTDFDVLFSRDDKVKGEEILKKLDFLLCKTQYSSRCPVVDDWIGLDKDTGRLIHVRLHFELVTGHKGMKEYHLLWNDMALRTRVLNAEYGVYTIEPNLEIVTLYTLIGLKGDFRNTICYRVGKFIFPEDVKREIEWLKTRVDMLTVRRLLDTYYGNKAGEMFEIVKKDIIESSDFLQLRSITEFTFKKCSRVRCFMWLREVSSFAYQRWRKRIIRKFGPVNTKKLLISGKGISIAFIGQDGSGKSTVTTDIEKWLSRELDAHRYYLGSGDHYHSWQKSIQKSLPEHKGIILSVFSVFLSLTKYNRLAKDVLKTIKNAETYRNKGGIALFDRYPQTQFLGINDGPKIRPMMKKTKNKFLQMIMSLFAKSEENSLIKAERINPNLVFKLILSPEESKRRKPHEDFEKIKRKHEIIKSLSFNNSKVYEIEATMNYDDELILIKQIIWQNIPKS